MKHWRRLVPDTIAGRTSVVLGLGFLLTLIASIAVFSLDLGPRRAPYPRLIERIATAVALVNAAPADVRQRLLPEVAKPPLALRWEPRAGPPEESPGVERGWIARHLADDLKQALADAGVGEVVFDKDRVWVQLADRSWLNVKIQRDAFGPFWFLRFILALAVLSVGIALLSVWAARRVTAPLGRFAAAAARLGTDVAAPPLAEAGPAEIRQAAHAFNTMQSRIQRFVEDRTLMLAAISHDLRTALTRLRLRAEFIDDPEQSRKAQTDLDEMQTMLDATLDFARDDNAAEAVTPLDLAVLLQSLCEDLADAGHDAHYHGPAQLRFDGRPVALRRVFANLIDNALRYGGAADVTLAEEEAGVCVEIADHGPGIPMDLREQVFAPFFRLEASRSRATGARGWGLPWRAASRAATAATSHSRMGRRAGW
ncbi:MAG: ATP-binding protein [Gammaproteobacteria bacterium]